MKCLKLLLVKVFFILVVFLCSSVRKVFCFEDPVDVSGDDGSGDSGDDVSGDDDVSALFRSGVLNLGGETVLRFARKIMRNETIRILGVGGSNMENFFGCAGHGCERSVHEGPPFTVLQDTPPFGSLEPWLENRIDDFRARGGQNARTLNSEYVLPQLLEAISVAQGRRNGPSARPTAPAAATRRSAPGWWPRRAATDASTTTTTTTLIGSPHTAINAGQSATNPQITLMCPEQYLYPDADLIIVEYAVNIDNPNDTRHVRFLVDLMLRLPSRPAVLIFDLNQWCLDDQLARLNKSPAECRKVLEDGELVLDRLQKQGSVGRITPALEKIVSDLAGEVGHVSVKKALMPLMEKRDTRAWPPSSLTEDGLHPAFKNQKCKLCKLFKESLMSWITLAMERANATAIPAELPPPPPAAHTDESNSVNCLNLKENETIAYTHDGSLEALAPQYRGQHAAHWFFTSHPLDGTDDQKKRVKAGLVAVAPNATVGIVLLPARLLEHRGKAIGGLEGKFQVSLSYLAAKDFVGAARVSCEGVCTCDTIVIDGGVDPPLKAVSRTRIFPLTISPHGHHVARGTACVANLKLESVGEKTKFKLIGMSVQRQKPSS